MIPAPDSPRLSLAINRAAGTRPIAGQPGRTPHRRPADVRRHAGRHRPGRTPHPLRELHHPFGPGRLALRRGAGPAGRGGASRSGCCTTGSAASATRSKLWRFLREAGAEVRAFNRPRLFDIFGSLSRDHRKLVVADGRRAVTGGLCIGNEWEGDARRGLLPWRDTGIEIEGPAAAALDLAFDTVWSRAGGISPYSDATGGRPPCGQRLGPDHRGAAQSGARLQDAGDPGGVEHRTPVDHRRVHGAAAQALPGLPGRRPGRRGHPPAGPRVERRAVHPEPDPDRLSRPAPYRSAHLRMGRSHAPRQDRRGGQPVDPGRHQQPQRVQPARQFRTRRADRRSRPVPRDGGPVPPGYRAEFRSGPGPAARAGLPPARPARQAANARRRSSPANTGPAAGSGGGESGWPSGPR